MSPRRDDADRGRRRRRFAAYCGALALALLIAGFVLTGGTEGLIHTVGEACVGLGIGIGVAAVFLASGFEPGQPR